MLRYHARLQARAVVSMIPQADLIQDIRDEVGERIGSCCAVGGFLDTRTQGSATNAVEL